MEKATEFRPKAFFAYVDFRAVFNSMNREALSKILASTGLLEKYYWLFKALHYGTENYAQVDNQRHPFFRITTGVRQGCAVAPELFNVMLDHVVTKTTSGLNFGLQLGDRVISDTDFTDDLAILADSMEQLLKVLEISREEAKNVGLQINRNNYNYITKIMAMDPSYPIVISPVSLDGTTSIEVVQRLAYLDPRFLRMARFSPTYK